VPIIIIEQIRSPIGRHHSQRETLIGLGLNKIGRIVRRPDTPETRGMVEKVKHLVRVIPPPLNEIKPLSRLRFNALAGYARLPATVLMFEELEWHGTNDERVIGALVRDRADKDFGWIVLGRDERLRFRAISAGSSLVSADAARDELFSGIKAEHAKPDKEFHQGDASGPPVDFFKPLVPEDRFNPVFRILAGPKYSPARGLIEAMMRFHEDADGNFIEQFQSTAFDARIWELYLFATFSELGYAALPDLAVPDFIFSSPFGSFGIEATTANPGAAVATPPDTKGKMLAYIENYIPIRLARSLRNKLDRKKPYWEFPDMKGKPFIIAIQDFHAPGSLTM
jgi:ribosomal protein L30